MNGIRWFGPLTIFVAEPLPPEQAQRGSRGSGGHLPRNVSALSDARFHEYVKVGRVLGARSIKH